MNFIERMTDAQRAVLIDSEVLFSEIEALIPLYKEAFIQANIKLPCENEEGLPVLNGCLNYVQNLVDYYSQTIDAKCRLVRRFATDKECCAFEEKHSEFNFFWTNFGFRKDSRKSYLGL